MAKLMLTLAHLSDVHLSPMPRPGLHHLLNKRFLGYVNWHRRKAHQRRDVLDRLTDDLLSRNPDHIAVTGDLVNIALPEEFRLARRWLDGLKRSPDEVSVVPGNHDAYSPFLRDPRLRYWQPYMTSNEDAVPFAIGPAPAPSFPFLRIFDKVALIGLSSARATLPGMASGWLGPRQIRQAGALLAQLGAQDYCRVVLIHHPPLPGMTSHMRALHDARNFRNMLIEHGAELVLHGHNHRTMQASLETKTGPLPIIGVSSASLIREIPEQCASYNFFRISKADDDNWRIAMNRRRFDPAGEFEDHHQDLRH